MKMYEIYFKKYMNTIYKIVNGPRPNMHGALKPKVNIREL
jgi:hypothetical protein